MWPSCAFCRLYFKPSFILEFIAVLLVLAAMSPGAAKAQQPDAQQGIPHGQSSGYDKAIFQKTIPPDQIAYLNQFAGAPAKDLLHDKQFKKLAHSFVPDCMFHYGHDMSLWEAMDTVLSGSKIPVLVRDGRYLLVAGAEGPYLGGRGFLWLDLQTGVGLGAFYFHPTNGEPTPTVTVFSRQVKEDALIMSELPVPFAQDLGEWSAESRVPPITTRYFIGDNHKRILLEHDEDFCAAPEGAPAPPKDVCLQMNADAADIDMNTAYYLDQVHYATNATAWMITGADQVAWLQVRDNRCGVGVNLCRISMTRERTQMIIHRDPVPHPIHH